MRFFSLLLLLLPGFVSGQSVPPVSGCGFAGSTTLYKYRRQQWVVTDDADSRVQTPPASTFKVINLLIALQTGVIRDENEVVRWVGKTDTTIYGYRPDIYHDMSVKEAFEVSAGWVFIELAKKIGPKRYRQFLTACGYGNAEVKKGDFWNFGPLKITPRNQVELLVKIYEEKLPFSKRSFSILKKVMITEEKDGRVIRSKTGWGMIDGKDIGWWIGYVEKDGDVCFFATRLTKPRTDKNPDFSRCRKDLTRKVLGENGF